MWSDPNPAKNYANPTSSATLRKAGTMLGRYRAVGFIFRGGGGEGNKKSPLRDLWERGGGVAIYMRYIGLGLA